MTATSAKLPGRPAKQGRGLSRKLGYMRRQPASLAGSSKVTRSDDTAITASCSDHTLSENADGSSATDTDWESCTTSPQFTFPSEPSDEPSDDPTPVSDFLLPPSDFADDFFDSPHVVQVSSLESGGREPFIQLDQDRLLSRGERTELYDLINGSMSLSLSSRYLTGSNGIFGLSDRVKTGFQCGVSSAPDFPFSSDISWLADGSYPTSTVDEASDLDCVQEDCTLP